MRLDLRTFCYFCRMGKHDLCDHHVNDGAVDALDFVNVRCDCPCIGRVPEGGKLIELVKELDDHNSELNEQVQRLTVQASRSNDGPYYKLLDEFADRVLTDEGELMVIGQFRSFRTEVERLLEDFNKMRDPSTDLEEEDEDDSNEFDEEDWGDRSSIGQG